MNFRELSEYIQLVLEQKKRPAELSGGRISEWGSDDHISDLEHRIQEMCYWRDKQKKGSESRANYSRVVQKLKTELRSAKLHAERIKLNEND
jgi:hypothetical protein